MFQRRPCAAPTVRAPSKPAGARRFCGNSAKERRRIEAASESPLRPSVGRFQTGTFGPVHLQLPVAMPGTNRLASRHLSCNRIHQRETFDRLIRPAFAHQSAAFGEGSFQRLSNRLRFLLFDLSEELGHFRRATMEANKFIERGSCSIKFATRGLNSCFLEDLFDLLKPFRLLLRFIAQCEKASVPKTIGVAIRDSEAPLLASGPESCLRY